MSHANALLTSRTRERLARLVVDDGWSVAMAAKMFMVSPVTARKWATRWRAEGRAGMQDRSSRPRTCSTRTSGPVVRKIVKLRWRHRLGPLQVGARLGLLALTGRFLSIVATPACREGCGMVGRWRPGPAGLETQRVEFSRLIASGVSNAEACRLVGVNRRTGTRWRFGRMVQVGQGRVREYPAVVATSCRVPSPRYLSQAERVLIADLHRTGASARAIAAELGRAPSTVTRELERNRDEAGRYRPLGAHQAALVRRRRPGRHRLARDAMLNEQVQQWLDRHWSPEQISRSLPRRSPASRGGN